MGITRSITQWPAHDGFLLYTDTELSVRVGTIRSAADASHLLQSHVDMVISLCPVSPMKRTPQSPDDRRSHFGALCIEHYLYYIPIEMLVTYGVRI